MVGVRLIRTARQRAKRIEMMLIAPIVAVSAVTPVVILGLVVIVLDCLPSIVIRIPPTPTRISIHIDAATAPSEIICPPRYGDPVCPTAVVVLDHEAAGVAGRLLVVVDGVINLLVAVIQNASP